MSTEPRTGVELRHSLCRVCNKGCPLIIEVRNGRATSVSGDRANPLFKGYTCSKGRALPSFLNDPNRLHHSMRRIGNTFEPVAVATAMDDIATRLTAIRNEYGPRAIATYYGTQMQNVPAGPLMRAFAQSLGTPMNFAASSVDKPGRPIAWAMLGRWQAPHHGFADPKVVMMLGINPFVNGLGGLPSGHPNNWLTERLQAGMELIVIDPRRSDIAKRATIFLQPRPGHDIPILAAMLHVTLQEDLYDRTFTAEHVRNLGELRRAVADFPPESVAGHAGLEPDEIIDAARVFARAGRGYAVAGTGPHMAGNGTLLEYLALCLDSVCGHWMRENEVVPHAGVLANASRPRAQAADPTPAYGFGERSRVRGLGMSAAGMPSATLAEEILLDGPGRVRALISCGGNPVAALPDQAQTIRALRSLDLLVQVDPWMSQTAELAHYVIAPKMTPEMIGTTLKIETASRGYATGYGFPADYAQYSDPVVAPPRGAEVIEDWELFYGLARRMNLELSIVSVSGESVPLNMSQPPTANDLVKLLFTGSRVPLSQVKKHPSGAFFPADPPVRVAAKEGGWTGRLDVGNIDMLQDLANHIPLVETDLAAFPFRLLNRRMAHVVNSSYNARVAAGHPGANPAYLCTADLRALRVAKGETVEIESPHGSIPAIVDVDDGLRPGTVSMSFGFGGGPETDNSVRTIGSSVARLLSTRDSYDAYSGQPRMSNVPVRIRATELFTQSASPRSGERNPGPSRTGNSDCV